MEFGAHAWQGMPPAVGCSSRSMASALAQQRVRRLCVRAHEDTQVHQRKKHLISTGPVSSLAAKAGLKAMGRPARLP